MCKARLPVYKDGDFLVFVTIEFCITNYFPVYLVVLRVSYQNEVNVLFVYTIARFY